MTTNLYGMSSTPRSAMLFTPVSVLDYIPPICRAFFLAEVIYDGIVGLFGTMMHTLEHHTLSICYFLTSHSYLSLTLTYTDDEDMHAAPRNSFPLFPLLPTELRQLIWSLALDPPSGRLFHIEALRRADFGRTEAHWAFYQRRGRPGGMTLAMCPTQRIPYIAASCKEAREVVRRHSAHLQQMQKRVQEHQGLPATAITAEDHGVKASMDSFRPESDILYIDALCLGCIPSPHVARNRIRTLASPRQGREVETIALEAGSLWSAAIGTNDVSLKPVVRREVLKAICEEFVGVKKLVLLRSRQREKGAKGGVWTRLWGSLSGKVCGKRTGEGSCEDETGKLDGKGASASQTTSVGIDKRKMGEGYGRPGSGAGMHLAFHPAVHGLTQLLGWVLGDDQKQPYIATRERPNRERGNRRSRRYIQQITTEKECCKTLPICLLDVEAFEELPDHILSGYGVNDDIESGDGVDEVEAVQTILGKLMEDGEITGTPLVERKIVVRSAGCTGPWSYRTGMASESCSNDDWYWQMRRMEQPVWRLREDGRRLEFS